MYKLEFTLKQHTPIIHFQHDQDGATLRASEVKPKLDRFILIKLGEQVLNNSDATIEERYQKGIAKAKDKKWLVGSGDHPALNYKIKIEDVVLKNRDIINQIELIERPKQDRSGFVIKKGNGEIDYFQYPAFFGNMGDEGNKTKKFSIVDQVNLSIISNSFKPDEVISNGIMEEFLAKTNFGMRQSKGFGSFYILGRKPSLKYQFTIDCSKPEIDSFKLNRDDREKFQPYKDAEYYKIKTLFTIISMFYSTLRSGINTSNFGGIYFKSLMFMYAKQLTPPQQWDKRTLREEFYAEHPTYDNVKERRWNDTNGTVHYNSGEKSNLLFRDLLGLSSDQDWMNYGTEKIDREGGPVTDRNGNKVYGSDTLSKKSINGEIDRFKSPIVFKPVRRENTDVFDVYIATEEIPSAYFNQQFEITSKKWRGKHSIMKIPSPQMFSIESYLEFCFKKVFPDDSTLKKHISNDDKKETKLLLKIFSELRNC